MEKLRSLLSSLILFFLFMVLLVKPEYAFEVASFRPIKEPDIQKLDRPSQKEDPGNISNERNTLEVKVPRDMKLGDFLELYQIDLPHIRSKIAGQIGKKMLKDSYHLKAGQRFTIDLTPPAGNTTQ